MGSVTRGHRSHRIGIRRRELIQAGFSGLLGFGMADLFSLAGAGPARADTGRPVGRGPRAKSVILVFMTGAPAHQDIWDIDASRALEYRGESRSVKTNVPGVEISERFKVTNDGGDLYLATVNYGPK